MNNTQNKNQILPNEILNIIFSFRGPHPIAVLLTPIFKEWQERSEAYKLYPKHFKGYNNYFYKVHLRIFKSKYITNKQVLNDILYESTKRRLDVILQQSQKNHPQHFIYNRLHYKYKTTDPCIIVVKDVYENAPRSTKTNKINFRYI